MVPKCGMRRMEEPVNTMPFPVEGMKERRTKELTFSFPLASSPVASPRPVYLLLLLLALTYQAVGSDVIRIGELNMLSFIH